MGIPVVNESEISETESEVFATLALLADRLADVTEQQQQLMEEVGDLRRRMNSQYRGFRRQLSASQKTSPASQPRSAADEYRLTVRRIRKYVQRIVPPQATLSVVTKGDAALLRLGERTALHFPQNRSGGYLGYHPAGNLSVIAQLEAARAAGTEFLVLPCASVWWLSHYSGFRDHLERYYALVSGSETVCRIYDLRQPRSTPDAQQLWQLVSEFRTHRRRDPAILDWHSAAALNEALPEQAVFRAPSARDGRLPYLDSSVDIVVLDDAGPERLSEASRVAAYAVLIADGDDPMQARLHRRCDSPAFMAESVSIIIPTYNGGRRLAACVRALQHTLPASFRGEILVVDDASPDGSYDEICREFAPDERVRFVRNPKNVGFIRTCNRAADLAGGDVLVFLNDDTVPLPGWLQPLCDTLRDAEAAGAVGGRLLYPDGSLQEAGGVLFQDGSGANFGRDDPDPERPIYSYVREVDYCSGALLATKRALFRQLGGFDTHFCPAYYEDTDYSFRLKSRGLRTYYQPASRVIHIEGSSSGTDPTSGTKRYQAVNRTKFVNRWERLLARKAAAPGHYDLATWYSLASHESDERCEDHT